MTWVLLFLGVLEGFDFIEMARRGNLAEWHGGVRGEEDGACRGLGMIKTGIIMN